MSHHMIGKLLGVAIVATLLLTGCFARPYNSPRESGYGYACSPYDDACDHHRHDDDKLATIVCSSKDGGPNRCPTDRHIQSAQIDQRYSRSPCEYGRAWGFAGNEIWVDRGCAARFVLNPPATWH